MLVDSVRLHRWAFLGSVPARLPAAPYQNSASGAILTPVGPIKCGAADRARTRWAAQARSRHLQIRKTHGNVSENWGSSIIGRPGVLTGVRTLGTLRVAEQPPSSLLTAPEPLAATREHLFCRIVKIRVRGWHARGEAAGPPVRQARCRAGCARGNSRADPTACVAVRPATSQRSCGRPTVRGTR